MAKECDSVEYFKLSAKITQVEKLNTLVHTLAAEEADKSKWVIRKVGDHIEIIPVICKPLNVFRRYFEFGPCVVFVIYRSEEELEHIMVDVLGMQVAITTSKEQARNG